MTVKTWSQQCAQSLLRLYRTHGLTSYWVVVDDTNRAWQVPADQHGWTRRVPYVGRLEALIPVPLYMAMGVGLPIQ